jgi:hypothetical protein
VEHSLSLKSVLIAAAFAAFALPASAAIITTTYYGTVSEGVDYYGFTVPAGRNLTGAAYTAAFVIDTDINRQTPGFNGEDDVVSGPSIFGDMENPMVSAIFKVNGTPLALPTSDFFRAFVVAGDVLRIGTSVFAEGFYYDFIFDSAGIPNRLTTPFDLLDGTGPYPSLGQVYFASEGQSLFQASLTINRVTNVVTAGAIPEPATWALMILGFGAAGAMLRQRRLVPN